MYVNIYIPFFSVFGSALATYCECMLFQMYVCGGIYSHMCIYIYIYMCTHLYVSLSLSQLQINVECVACCGTYSHMWHMCVAVHTHTCDIHIKCMCVAVYTHTCDIHTTMCVNTHTPVTHTDTRTSANTLTHQCADTPTHIYAHKRTHTHTQSHVHTSASFPPPPLSTLALAVLSSLKSTYDAVTTRDPPPPCRAAVAAAAAEVAEVGCGGGGGGVTARADHACPWLSGMRHIYETWLVNMG